jgi:AraC-like DNA-binding protein
MAAVATLLTSRTGLTSLRRSFLRGGPRLLPCRTTAQVEQTLATRFVDAVLLATADVTLAELRSFRGRFPAVPVVAWGAFRPDDGELLASWQREGAALLLVDGVDDPVAGELVRRASLTALRRSLLSDAPRVLRLTHPLQHRTWELLLDRADRPARTIELAAALEVSREHLSRQFGAGGAPNLKRVIDLIRVAAAAQLLANPGLDLAAVVRILDFASPSHLERTVRRITGQSARDLGALGVRGVLGAFTRGKTRSRRG